MFLTPDEIVQLTRRTKFGAQKRELRELGIFFLERTDGSPVVLRSALEAGQSHEPQRPRVRRTNEHGTTTKAQ